MCEELEPSDKFAPAEARTERQPTTQWGQPKLPTDKNPPRGCEGDGAPRSGEPGGVGGGRGAAAARVGARSAARVPGGRPEGGMVNKKATQCSIF